MPSTTETTQTETSSTTAPATTLVQVLNAFWTCKMVPRWLRIRNKLRHKRRCICSP